MKFGVREICDVVLRAKSTIKIGNYTFYKDMPVFYFDSLKTSSLEGQATTVYAQGGKGNTKLIAWEGEKTVTFTMEDALISTTTLSMLTGAQVIDSTSVNAKPSYAHAVETVETQTGGLIYLSYQPIAKETGENSRWNVYAIPLDERGDINGAPVEVVLSDGEPDTSGDKYKYTLKLSDGTAAENSKFLIDYYYEDSKRTVTMFNITPDKFAGNYYLEASTLFKNKAGKDLPAEFIIPNCKIQSNFTFSMASSGDPSTFTFTLDAFPDYTKQNPTEKVLAAIQMFEDIETGDDTVANNGNLGSLDPFVQPASSYAKKDSFKKDN
jgi:hypothetical protein